MELHFEPALDAPVSRAGRAPTAGGFEDFYRAQADRVYRALAVTLTNPHLAREATDEAMARAYARWSMLRDLDNPGGWVYRVGLNWATSWWRKVRRERSLDPGLDRAAPADAAPAEVLDALSRLAVEQRAVIVCRVLLDLSTNQTAEVLGLAVGTVKSRLARALASLRAALMEGNHDV